jgi:hypothetical protein
VAIVGELTIIRQGPAKMLWERPKVRYNHGVVLKKFNILFRVKNLFRVKKQ